LFALARRRLGALTPLGGVTEDAAIALRELLLEALDLLPELRGVFAFERIELPRQLDDLRDELLVFALEHQRGLAEDLDVGLSVEVHHGGGAPVRHIGRGFQQICEVSPSAARDPRASTGTGSAALSRPARCLREAIRARSLSAPAVLL